MKRGLSYSTRIIGLAIGIVAGSVLAQTTANGPYYATPSWDQQLPASTRFIVLSNWGSAAVLDRETGLVWEKSPSTSSFPWSDNTKPTSAATHCNQLTVGNRGGWRLPTVQELDSLVDYDPTNTSAPRLPPGHPFTNVPSMFSSYWTANTLEVQPLFAWTVFFGNAGGAGPAVIGEGKILTLFVWCVRGGQGVDPQ